ncbi:MAG TPA: ABC transporter ATP-binding protein [Xanthobacteraceae bacterium]|nr:ABC transporter ATP-binding protein [Xanthobacteraceae bacterium]
MKRFGSVIANDIAHVDVRPGEVLALLGENGAGKSTLAKILYGFYTADAGDIRVRGQRVEIASPRDARALGIGMVFQNFTLVPALSVYENVALFVKDRVMRRRDILGRMAAHAERFHLAADPWQPVRQLAVGDQQKVEILKQIVAGARVLILDEPTKVLAPQECEGLFATMAELRAEGFGVVLITHKLREVLRCADRIAVMRQGRIAGLRDRREATEDDLLAMMFGEAPVAQSRRQPRPVPDGRADALVLAGVSTAAGAGATPLQDLSIRIRAGEIVGVAGVSGNGQRELGELVLGLRRPRTGTKLMWGEDASRWSVATVRDKGVAAIPDDPLALACVPGLTVRENLALGTRRRYRAGLGVDWRKLDDEMQRSFARLAFPRPDFAARAATLSGGNLQRVVLARELAHAPKLIVALYPTRGLDARSTMMVRALLDDSRDGGAAVMIISEDLDELFALSDRLLVLHRGALAGEFSPEDFRAEAVGPLMVGAGEERADAG